MREGVLIFEDDSIEIYHAFKAAKGHMRIYPKKQVKIVDELSDDVFIELMMAANYCSAILFELLGAHGTNLILNESDDLHVDVIERQQDDGIDLAWDPKQADQADLEQMKSAIADKIIVGEAPSNQEHKVPDNSEDVKQDEGEVNYLIKHLDKIP